MSSLRKFSAQITYPFIEALVRFAAYNTIYIEMIASRKIRSLMKPCFRAGFASGFGGPKSDPDMSMPLFLNVMHGSPSADCLKSGRI
jgi:hypothetical protein